MKCRRITQVFYTSSSRRSTVTSRIRGTLFMEKIYYTFTSAYCIHTSSWLNFPTHSCLDIVSYINLAYWNEILTFFFVSFFNFISLYKLHFLIISGLLNAHLLQVGSWKYTRPSNLPNATQEVNGRARDKLNVSILFLGSLQKHSFSATETQTLYEKGKEYQQIWSVSEFSDISHAWGSEERHEEKNPICTASSKML